MKKVFGFIVILLLGALIGVAVARNLPEAKEEDAGPSMDEAIAFFSKPLPLPEGVKGVTIGHEGRSGGGVGSTEMSFHFTMILDVSNVEWNELVNIPKWYSDYFFMGLVGGNGGLSGWGHKNELTIVSGENAGVCGSWTMGYEGRGQGTHLGMTLALRYDGELYDYDKSIPGLSSRRRLPIHNAGRPVRGQRIMLLRFVINSRGFKKGEKRKLPDFDLVFEKEKVSQKPL